MDDQRLLLDKIEKPQTLRECFFFDLNEVTPDPGNWRRRIASVILAPGYGMPVLMRLAQYYFRRGMVRRASIFMALNRIFHNFEHGADPEIGKGVIFHHGNVCITSKTVIEPGVHIFRGVLFGMKNDQAPVIKRDAKIASHSSVIGGVTVGEHAVVAVGAVVVKDVPAYKIAAGVPARIIGDVTEKNYSF